MASFLPAPCRPVIPDGPKRLFAMVSTRSSRAYTPHALRSFFETTGMRGEDRLILINNDDPDFDEIATPFRDHITLITRPEPYGFSKNANTMIEEALRTGSDLFFMNNDVIFTDNWLAPLTGYEHSILSPISNREVQYVGSAVVVKTHHVLNMVTTQAPMDIEHYLASPRMFQAIAEAHNRSSSGLLTLIVFPFFCVRLPQSVMQRVGKFDESFGMAGGEDYDYCLRACLAGFDVQMNLASYLLHFWGKSTWTAGEKGAPNPNYNIDFLEVFRKKWGEALFQFVLRDKDSLIQSNPEAKALLDSRNLPELIRLLMPNKVDIHIS